MAMANLIATWSTDPGRRVGTVIVDKNNVVLGSGYNGVPRRVVEHDLRISRKENGHKYLWIEHAERNAIYGAASAGIRLQGATLYTTLFPCADCSRAIIQSGITRLVTPPLELEATDPFYASCAVGREMMLEAEIEISELKEV